MSYKYLLKFVFITTEISLLQIVLVQFFGICRKRFSKQGRIFTRNLYLFLTDSNLTLNRKNMDKGNNNSGKLLINLCKRQNLFIMNARVGSDINIGELTCRNASAVDYFFVH